MKNLAICTISSANFFPFAKTLLQSIARVHSDCDLFYLLVDRPQQSISAETGFQTIQLEELKIPHLMQMTFVYDIVELNTAVKPFFLSYLMQKGYSKVIYIDPDIFVFNRLDSALAALDTHSIVLTPHALSPASPATSFAGKVQWEQNMLVGGIFNLGFIGIANRQSAREFLVWWQNRCTFLCFTEPIVGLFVDQKWAELAIAYWDDVFILRDPGYNVSIWNLYERSVDNTLVNQSHKLIFYHFSSININNDSFLSKHDTSMTFQQYPALKGIFSDYRAELFHNGYEHYKTISYAYGLFKGGKRIDVLERRLYVHAADDSWNPFACTKREFYRNIKKHSRKAEAKHTSYLFFLATFFGYWLFRIIGARNYRILMMLGTKAIQLRAHSYLIQ